MFIDGGVELGLVLTGPLETACWHGVLWPCHSSSCGLGWRPGGIKTICVDHIRGNCGLLGAEC